MGADAQARDGEPNASKADEAMEDADGGKVGEVGSGTIRSEDKGSKAKEDKPLESTEDTEVQELDKVQGGSYSCTAL